MYTYPLTNLPILLRSVSEQLAQMDHVHDICVDFYADQDKVHTSKSLAEALGMLADGLFYSRDGDMVIPDAVILRAATSTEIVGH